MRMARRLARINEKTVVGDKADIRTGNALPLSLIPLGTTIHNVELKPRKGGQMARSAGAGVQVVAKEGDYVTLRLPSTEVRRVRKECLATTGFTADVERRTRQGGHVWSRLPRSTLIWTTPVAGCRRSLA